MTHAYAGPAALLAVGSVLVLYGLARFPMANYPAILAGAAMAAYGLAELRFRFKARQIAKRARSRGHYIHDAIAKAARDERPDG